MSDVHAFLASLENDVELQDALRQIEDANRDVTLETVTALAATKGHSFTPAELRAVLTRPHPNVLGDRELERVAGGLGSGAAAVVGLKFLPTSIRPSDLAGWKP